MTDPEQACVAVGGIVAYVAVGDFVAYVYRAIEAHPTEPWTQAPALRAGGTVTETLS